MKIRELWPILAPAARRTSLGRLAAENFDPSGKQASGQLLAMGFNAGAWMYSLVNVFSWRQAGTGQSHEMKIIFHHLSAISQLPLHAYFVFDGPDCPQLKHELLTAFGFKWHVAPGEAEAELAYLQSLGLVDAVVTPYNDALLFGATCIVCSVPNSDRYEDVYFYSPDALEKHASLEWGDLLLVRLMSSTDNDAGCRWCSVEVACRLAYYGFGRTLLDAAVSFQFIEYMDFVAKWRDDICDVLTTDPLHLLRGRHYEIARIIKEECTEFPDPVLLTMYLLPRTSWSEGHSPITVTTSRQPDLQSLATFCQQHLSWSPGTVQSELIDVCAGVAIRALLQLPGNADSEVLRCGLRVVSYSGDSYKISVPSQPLAVPPGVNASPAMDMSPPGEDGNSDASYEMEVPAVVLKYLRPDLARGSAYLSSPLSCVESEDEDVGGQPLDPAVNFVALSPEAGVIDLTGGEDLDTGVYDPM